MRLALIAHARTLKEADRLREALAKYEPEPVDPDRDAVERILLAAWPYSHVSDYFRDAALAQYKAERPTITDDEALLIAREIAAKFASNFSWVIAPSDCCKGEMDHTNAQKFALAMVKRDPAALEAFRGGGPWLIR